MREIRIAEADGASRVIYVATLPAAIYVLHCFRKQTQKTGRLDLALAERRYRDLVEELRG